MQTVGSASLLPAGVKRPALVDSKTGLPVYQTLSNTASPYQQILQVPATQPRYVALGPGKK